MDEEKEAEQRVNDELYVEIVTPSHHEMVFLGEIVVPHNHVFMEGDCLITDFLVYQMFLENDIAVKCCQRIISMASSLGEHPAVIPLPQDIMVSKH